MTDDSQIVSNTQADPSQLLPGQSSPSQVTGVVQVIPGEEDRPGASSQAIIQNLQQVGVQQVPDYSGGFGKEQSPLGVELNIDHVGSHPVEIEQGGELPPEVDKFIQAVEDHQNQLPEEIVVADDTVMHPTGRYVSKPVIVLPMTEEELHQAKKTSPTMSKRWLAEFTEKVMKMFAGSVIYRES